MRKIAVVTGSRAEYGLLYWILKSIKESSKLELQLIVTGMHLSHEFGYTVEQIFDDGFQINKKIDMIVSGHTPVSVTKSMGLGCIGFAQAYEELKPDILLVLGDRYEILCAVMSAIPFKIPIAHIAGGEITEGAMDEQIRHAITKAAHIHFPGTEIYADNIRNMGEESWRVFNVGDSGIEAIRNSQLLTEHEIFSKLNLIHKKKTILVTLHPTTLNSIEKEKNDIKTFFKVLKEYKKTNIIVTYPNSDTHSNIIINEIKRIETLEHVYVFKNLGSIKYLSVLKYCDLVLGNSSSGIAEAPFFKKPVINYGERQKGRLKAENIVDIVAGDGEGLKNAIDKALYDKDYLHKVKLSKNLYGDGRTSHEIVNILESIDLDDKLLKKKLVFK